MADQPSALFQYLAAIDETGGSHPELEPVFDALSTLAESSGDPSATLLLRMRDALKSMASTDSDGLIIGCTFLEVRDFALSCLISGDPQTLAAMAGGYLSGAYTSRLSEWFSAVGARKNHFALTAADHYGFHVMSMLHSLTGKGNEREFFTTSFPVARDLPFLGFVSVRSTGTADA